MRVLDSATPALSKHWGSASPLAIALLLAIVTLVVAAVTLAVTGSGELEIPDGVARWMLRPDRWML